MKQKTATFLLGLCVAALALAANPAYARSTTGFNSFKVWMADKNQFKDTYGCLTEFFGAVVNQCGFPVSLLFDVPIDNAGSHTFTVQNYFEGSAADNTFSCQSFDYNGAGGIVNGTVINFTGPTQTLSTTVTATGDSSIQLICSDIPNGGGVANINWAP
jgi:hypothetical protein